MVTVDVHEITQESVSDIYYFDTGMYDTPEYGAVYIIDAPEPTVVDTGMGPDVEKTLAALGEVGIDHDDVANIVPTHVHLDHAGGAGYLADACENATVHCPAVGAHHLADPERLWEGTRRAVGDQFQYYREPKPIPESRIEELHDGDELDIGDRTLHVHDAPGHAPHQCLFYSPDDDAVFTADAAGLYVRQTGEIRPTSPPSNFDFEQCLADIDTIRDIDPAVLLYPHFGPADTGEKLDTYERVLTEWVERVEQARTEHETDAAVVEAVATRVEGTEPWPDEKVYNEAAMNVRGVLGYLDARAE